MLVAMVKLGNAVKCLIDHLFERNKVRTNSLLGKLENEILGLIEEFACFESGFVTLPDDARAQLNERSNKGLLLHDVGVVLDVRRRWNNVDQLGQVLHTANTFEFPLLPELLSQGHQIADFVLIKELGHALENDPVRLVVKVLRAQDFKRLQEGFPVKEHRSQRCLLGFNTVWRNAINAQKPTPRRQFLPGELSP